MKILKLQRGRAEPEFAIYVRRCMEPGHPLNGLVLVNFPTSAPERKRQAKWIDLAEYRAIWLREFTD